MAFWLRPVGADRGGEKESGVTDYSFSQGGSRAAFFVGWNDRNCCKAELQKVAIERQLFP